MKFFHKGLGIALVMALCSNSNIEAMMRQRTPTATDCRAGAGTGAGADEGADASTGAGTGTKKSEVVRVEHQVFIPNDSDLLKPYPFRIVDRDMEGCKLPPLKRDDLLESRTKGLFERSPDIESALFADDIIHLKLPSELIAQVVAEEAQVHMYSIFVGATPGTYLDPSVTELTATINDRKIGALPTELETWNKVQTLKFNFTNGRHFRIKVIVTNRAGEVLYAATIQNSNTNALFVVRGSGH